MARPFICLGDRTDHGGTVVEADYTFDVDGRPVALVGHKVVCRKCRGTFPIVSGADDMTCFGIPVARHGDKTECGATLLASQVVATWSNESSVDIDAATGAQAAEAALRPAGVAAETPTLCLECLAAAAARGDTLVARG